MKNDIRVTSKKEGVVFASDPSGGIKVSLHGLKKEDYKKVIKGDLILHEYTQSFEIGKD